MLLLLYFLTFSSGKLTRNYMRMHKNEKSEFVGYQSMLRNAGEWAAQKK